jgi:hypothetical protein
MDVFITIDTEISSVRVRNWRETQLDAEIRRDILGHTAHGDFGIVYQMEQLKAHGLKATYFVESLFASVVGLEPLQRIVAAIRDRGQDIQLHAHPNWLDWLSNPDEPPPVERTMCAFTRAEQVSLIREAQGNLTRSGVDQVVAFRAGDFDANPDTLRAARANGIAFDTSVNLAYGRGARLISADPILTPTRAFGVAEFPVTVFRSAGGSLRPLQVCACSSGEMESLLLRAWRAGWRSAVILLHSFELIVRPRHPGQYGLPAPIRRRRFDRLCRFLGEHRDKFQTRTFAELSAESCETGPQPSAPLRVPLCHTVRRYLEQAADRLLHSS